MYTLKSMARRSVSLGAAVALFVAAVIPGGVALADALNPLTDRSLTLSSSAPGWDNKDGSGNTTYAPPNSGANGQQTGNTFDFKVSSDTLTGSRKIKAMTFQYCLHPAGDCIAPGNNDYTGTAPTATRINNGWVTGSWNDHKSDLNIVESNSSQATLGTYLTDTNSATNPDGVVSSVPAPTATGSNFLVYALNGSTWEESAGWEMTAGNGESGGAEGDADGYTGANNQITLTNTGDGEFAAGTRVKVVFFGTNTNYITNPGANEFFVRINHWDDATARAETNVIDGGVTVANVMNQSIQIMTKVLETMDFSVGTVDPNTLDSTDPDTTGPLLSQYTTATGGQTHGPCDPVVKSMNASDPLTSANALQLGDENGEFSLETDNTYSTHSYWRLSSNSSGGATVYYSGVSLMNTVGDKIDAIYNTTAGDGEAQNPVPGMEQFGLALDNSSDANNLVSYAKERTAPNVFQNGDDNDVTGVHASTTTDIGSNPSYHTPGLYSLVPASEYGGGTGFVNSEYGALNTEFAFDETSNTIPVALAATENIAGEVVDCVSGKVRYIANIASTTPAGIYTTKINYIASPKY